MNEEDPIFSTIREHLEAHPVLLYMKGTPKSPLCGFSAQVVRILCALDVVFHSVDVLAWPEIRQAIKTFSQWPTVPQLYVNKTFIGGCDIVQDMYRDGELKKLLRPT